MRKFFAIWLMCIPIKAADRVEIGNDLLAQEGKFFQKSVWCVGLTSSLVSSFLQLCNVQIVEDQPVTSVRTLSSLIFTAGVYSLRYKHIRQWLWNNKSDVMFALFSVATMVRFFTDIGVIDGQQAESLGEMVFYLSVYGAFLLYKLKSQSLQNNRRYHSNCHNQESLLVSFYINEKKVVWI